eukprot:TRINITY_DN124_c0_g1::TRINITY_DN124_c0_g1_i1::g.14441::m.14441 TRINITY_DN124_c0_g1::TRINITY_DN124_c0_g1_i1::g.14441  ORF type:complete len:390 (+),score=70.85,bZIP_2/PF07716.10/3.3e+03,bZIP_2/PF07716.10/1.5e+04,bZIP_2/PF07716.10/0.00034,bZIP_2/PF07716.10/19,bZIP_1/PF00170.16/1.5e+04,bZIP_1/PF00170.16/0.081,bZIP_Maf/PF03131.12/0.053,bZIP_Maf/PF03131.12/2.2e+02,IncA/PF04156.9/0.15,DUF3138/PF11336.3/0.18,Mnd1/PF03962.10/0.21,DUF342/PF03961.8/0.79,Seryl_tRNA_N/PF02403.17/1.2,FlxA/PF14282.1/8.7e+03,Fl
MNKPTEPVTPSQIEFAMPPAFACQTPLEDFPTASNAENDLLLLAPSPAPMSMLYGLASNPEVCLPDPYTDPSTLAFVNEQNRPAMWNPGCYPRVAQKCLPSNTPASPFPNNMMMMQQCGTPTPMMNIPLTSVQNGGGNRWHRRVERNRTPQPQLSPFDRDLQTEAALTPSPTPSPPQAVAVVVVKDESEFSDTSHDEDQMDSCILLEDASEHSAVQLSTSPETSIGECYPQDISSALKLAASLTGIPPSNDEPRRRRTRISTKNMTAEEKRARRVLNNRLSADRHRQRKKHELEIAQHQIAALSQKVITLETDRMQAFQERDAEREQANLLRDRVTSLEQELASLKLQLSEANEAVIVANAATAAAVAAASTASSMDPDFLPYYISDMY